MENSSFIAASAYPDKDIHGCGFVARLTGTTTEFLTMWLVMCLGREPFKLDARGKPYFEPAPAIPCWLFTEKKTSSSFYADGGKQAVSFPKNTFAFCLFGRTLVVYHNSKRANTFGKGGVKPKTIRLEKAGQLVLRFDSGRVPAPHSYKIRDGFYDRIDIELF